MKSILITGCYGFIGQHLSKFFYSKGFQIYGISRSVSNNYLAPNFEKYINKQQKGKEIAEILKEVQPDYIFHCAGNSLIQKSILNPLNDFNDNTLFTFELLNTVKNFSPKSILYLFSSAAVYGNPISLPIKEDLMSNPISPYGFHKLYAENICYEFSKLYSLKIVILRIFSAYGPGLRRQIIYDLTNQFVNSDIIQLKGTGRESRDFIHVLDLCLAIESIIREAHCQFEIYNIGSGQEISIKELSEKFLMLFDKSKEIVFDFKSDPGAPLNWRSDITKLKSLGFEPSISLSEGISEYIRWFMSINLKK